MNDNHPFFQGLRRGMTFDQLCETFHGRWPPVYPNTVREALDDLEKSGDVVRDDSGDGQVIYRVAPGKMKAAKQ